MTPPAGRAEGTSHPASPRATSSISLSTLSTEPASQPPCPATGAPAVADAAAVVVAVPDWAMETREESASVAPMGQMKSSKANGPAAHGSRYEPGPSTSGWFSTLMPFLPLSKIGTYVSFLLAPDDRASPPP